MKLFRAFQIIAFSIFISGCTLMQPVNIQVLKPSQIALPPKIKKIVLINHAIRLDNDSSHLRTDDSLLTANYFAGLLQQLHNSPAFEITSDTAVIVPKPSGKQFVSLDTATLQSIIAEKNGDAGIVLENYQVVYNEPIKIKFSAEYGYYGTLSVENSSLWKIYTPLSSDFLDDFLLKDTLFWDAAGNSEDEIIDQMPRLHTAAIQSCFYAGMKYAERIAPLWDIEQRLIFLPNNWDFYRAWELTQQNEWLSAIEIWRRHAYGKNKRLAAMACYNMAVAAELFDNLDAALDWAAKSYLIKNRKFVDDYIQLLEKRKKLKNKIEQQQKKQ